MHWGRRRQWHPTPVLLPGKSHGWRSLVGCSPWGRQELDMTERLHFDFSLSCIAEGKGNPLQCSCLENPRDGGLGGLPSMGSHRVRHDWSDLVAAAAAVISQSVYFFRVNVHSPFTPLVEIILIFQGPVWVSDPLWSLPQFSRFNCSFYYTFLLPTLLLNSSSLLPLR